MGLEDDDTAALGIFGGSFNPPHVAHLLIAETVRERFSLDRILWIPAGIPPHKVGVDMPDAEHRLAMVRLATAGNPAFEVSEVEVWRDGASYTIDTLEWLQSTRPNCALNLILGGDNFSTFDTWRRPDDILGLASIIVYDRPGSGYQGLPSKYLEAATFYENPWLIPISSTEIRARHSQGHSIRYAVPDAVVNYIREKDLYIDARS